MTWHEIKDNTYLDRLALVPEYGIEYHYLWQTVGNDGRDRYHSPSPTWGLKIVFRVRL